MLFYLIPHDIESIESFPLRSFTIVVFSSHSQFVERLRFLLHNCQSKQNQLTMISGAPVITTASILFPWARQFPNVCGVSSANVVCFDFPELIFFNSLLIKRTNERRKRAQQFLIFYLLFDTANSLILTQQN